MIRQDTIELVGLIALAVHSLGFLNAVYAILTARTPQGSIAWAISLVSFPWLAVPLYWVFGRTRFQGYVQARRKGNLEINHIADKAISHVLDFRADALTKRPEFHVLERLVRLPYTRGNALRLLVNGEATFDAIFDALDRAKHYALVQFFIVHDDRLGRDLKDRLLACARRGVKILFLYDEVGSHKLPAAYVAELRAAGVEMHAFRTTRGRTNRFQINFRNHRKIVVVDGEVAFLGGLNVGDEYMGRDPKFGPWRDTHLRIEGPAVMSVQLSFIEDWYWATRRVPNLNWVPRSSSQGDISALVLPTSPADSLETCALFFEHAIHSARKRLWIASPYFVPDRAVEDALVLAGLRGVDVRIMLPLKPDHLLVYLSSFSYLPRTDRLGVRIYRYEPGFLHQKVMLVDDDIAAVGTANLDNRSFRLNFEITALAVDAAFAREVEGMLLEDFRHCRLVHPSDYFNRSRGFRFAVRIARLFDPIQ